MKKTKKCLHIAVIFLALFRLLSVCSYAEGESASEVAKEKTDELLSDFSLILPQGMESLSTSEGAGEALGFESLLRGVIDAISGELPTVGRFFLLLIGISVLFAVVDGLGGALGGTARSAVAILSSGLMLSFLLPLFHDSLAALSDIGELFGLLIPIMTSAAALTGGGSLAGVSGLGTSLTLSLFGGVSSLLLPLVLVFTALGIISVLAPDAVWNLAAVLRRFMLRAIGIVTLVIGALFAIQTTVAAASDGAALRAMKYAATGSIPVVGSTVSGALGTLAGGLEYSASVIGGGGTAAILVLALSPLARLLLYKLAFFVSGLLTDALPSAEGSAVFRAVSGGLDMLVAVYSLGSVIYLFETVVLMKGIISVL